MAKAGSKNYDVLQWTVISDPTGDFRSGAKLSGVEMKIMIKNAVLPVGMVLEYDNTQYTVNKYHHIVM